MAPVKIAYIMSRFPKATETFVLHEMVALEARGVTVEVFPLLRGPSGLVHAKAVPFVRRARFQPFFSWPILLANLRRARLCPGRYLRLWWDVLRAAFGSANFFIGAIGIFPKSVLFAREMERLGITHIHAHFANHPAVAALIINRLTGIPFSFTAHGSDLHVDRHMLREKVVAAAFVVTVSNYNKQVITDECGEDITEKVLVIHCGVDPAVFAPAPQKEPDGPLRILCVASFEEVKGHTFLVDACRLLQDRGVEFECDLVGNGPLRRKIESQIIQGRLSARFRLHGVLTTFEISQLLSEAHVSVLASVPTKNGKREGIPVALMEAMASGVPVVASRLSGIPELVESGRGGILVPPGDSAALADAIELLAHQPALRTHMGTSGRCKVEREFDLRANADRLLEQIQVCARARPEAETPEMHRGAIADSPTYSSLQRDV